MSESESTGPNVEEVVAGVEATSLAENGASSQAGVCVCVRVLLLGGVVAGWAIRPRFVVGVVCPSLYAGDDDRLCPSPFCDIPLVWDVCFRHIVPLWCSQYCPFLCHHTSVTGVWCTHQPAVPSFHALSPVFVW